MKESSYPSLGFQQIQGLKLMRKLLQVGTPTPQAMRLIGLNLVLGYFTTGHRMTEEELAAVKGRSWEEWVAHLSDYYTETDPNIALIIDLVNRKPSRCSGRTVECTCMYTRQRISSPKQELHHFFAFTALEWLCIAVNCTPYFADIVTRLGE
jgi:hypothetical protein